MFMDSEKYTDVDMAEIATIALELGEAMWQFDQFGHYTHNMKTLLGKMKTYRSVFEPILVRCTEKHPNFAKCGYKIPE